eukprot:Rmarinus@m.13866
MIFGWVSWALSVRILFAVARIALQTRALRLWMCAHVPSCTISMRTASRLLCVLLALKRRSCDLSYGMCLVLTSSLLGDPRKNVLSLRIIVASYTVARPSRQ